MKRRLVQAHPCAKCPWLAKFRGADDYLHPARRPEIMRSVLSGAGFSCHETTEYDDDIEDMVATADSIECAGLALVLLRADHAGQGVLKVAERLGSFNPDEFLASNTAVETWTLDQVTETGDEDFGPCNTVGPNCIAPAGYMIGGAAVSGTESADGECPSCGEPVCSECANDEGLCGNCAEEDEFAADA